MGKEEIKCKIHIEFKEGGFLVARLIENGEISIELTYTNRQGDSQVVIYGDGMEVSRRVSSRSKMFLLHQLQNKEGKAFLPGYLAVYDRLGPELRTQIPPDWHAVLGKWLTAKE